jgi:signal transduction histidine kinase
VLFLAAFAAAEAATLPPPPGNSRAVALLFGLLLALVFLPRRHLPVLVAIAAIAVNRVQFELLAVPHGATVFSIAVPVLFYGVAVYTRRRRALGLLLVSAVYAGDTAWIVAASALHGGGQDPTTVAIGYSIYCAALAAIGIILGLTVRDRGAEVTRLRTRVDGLEADLPAREIGAAAAEQRRLAADTRWLVTDLVRRVDRSLAAAAETLPQDPLRARAIVADSGDRAREVLARMRAMLDRLRADDVDERDCDDAIAAPPGNVDELTAAIARRGLTLRVRRDDDRPAPEVVVAAADRIAAVAAELLGGPPRAARVHVGRHALRLELRGGPRRLRPPARSNAALAALERVRLMGGRVREHPWRGTLAVTLPTAPARARRAPRHHAIPRPLREHPVVVLIAALGIIEQLFMDVAAPLALGMLLAVAQPLPLLVRERRPFLAVAGVQVILVAGTAAGALGGLSTQSVVAGLAAAFAAGASRLGPVTALVAAGLCFAGSLWSMVIDSLEWPWQTYASFAVTVGICWLVGRLVRDRLEEAAATRRAIDQTDQRRRELEANAAARERARLAREIHDVVGHAVLVICVQAGAAETMAPTDPTAARESIASARGAAETAVRELGRLALLLPAAGDEELPGVADLPVLVEQLRGTGFDVELHFGVSAPVAPDVGAAVYRIVQEALTNAGKHAPGEPVRVDLDATGARLTVRVANPLPARARAASPDGDGLRNMVARADACGGELRSGPDGADWVVEATFERPSADASTDLGRTRAGIATA